MKYRAVMSEMRWAHSGLRERLVGSSCTYVGEKNTIIAGPVEIRKLDRVTERRFHLCRDGGRKRRPPVPPSGLQVKKAAATGAPRAWSSAKPRVEKLWRSSGGWSTPPRAICRNSTTATRWIPAAGRGLSNHYIEYQSEPDGLVHQFGAFSNKTQRESQTNQQAERQNVNRLDFRVAIAVNKSMVNILLKTGSLSQSINKKEKAPVCATAHQN
uniref:Uncharacterized protein n=1 Tax=Oryza nivara TaxID=4536 RepID=A0A0E0FI75_ORYNI